MTAGIHPAGVGPAGAVLGPSSSSDEPVQPRALYFDPESGRFLLDERGQLRDLHPVDHAVVLALGIELGAVPSAPTLGNRLRANLASVPREARGATAMYSVQEALRRLIDRGDVALLSVDVDAPQPNTITVRYSNLREGHAAPRALQLR